MAANNYFGFTHGGTQYAATGTAAYQAASQPGYAVAPTAAAAAAATYNTQRAATGYDTYQPAAQPGTYAVAAGTSAPTTYDYGYARTAPTAYDTTKTYYQQAAPATQAYSTADYQAKAGYNATYTTQSVRPATAQQHKTAQYNTGYTAPQQQTPAANYTYTSTPVQAQQPANKFDFQVTTGTTYNGGGTVSYGNGSTSTNFSSTYTAQNPTTVQTTAAQKPKTVYSAAMYMNQGKQNNTWQGYKKPAGAKQMRAKPQPKPQQLHYCEVCKISCAGPQTYREHLEGQRHKKKEALQKEGATPAAGSRGGNNLRCELCDVVCTGSDAYAAHLRGAKHQKVVNLHTRLGKPIPNVDMKTAKAAAASTTNSAVVSAPPKINFIQSGNLGTVSKPTDAKEDAKEESNTAADVEMTPTENEVTPVGQEYIEEIKNEDGKLISFNCKLCECKFNDPNAKDMHMKGRRHRLQFKKKVNPDLVVDVKPSGRRGRMQEEKLRRRDDFLRRREDESFWTDRLIIGDDRLYWEERRRFEEEFEYMEWMRRRGPAPAPFLQPIPFGIRRPDTLEDRHFHAKHQLIYPKEAKIQAVNKVVSHTEKALKLVTDQITDQQKKTKEEATSPTTKKEVKKDNVPAPVTTPKAETPDASKAEPVKTEEKDTGRIIRAVLRVGALAKGLILSEDIKVDLVVLCAEIPTKTLLNNVFSSLQTHMKTIAPEENYTITLSAPDAAVLVQTSTDAKITVAVTLTSPVLREMLMQAAEGEGGSLSTLANLTEALDQAKCLEALAQLRRAKWFQARPANNPSSVMVIRILRDLCQRNPTWAPLSPWAIELLVDRVVGCVAFSGAEALRKVLEAIAGGILLPGSNGIADPCEREPTDATADLNIQQRADITASAQHALRLLAFRQIHKVLGMTQIQPPRHAVNRHGGVQRFNRKRRRDHSAGETNDSEVGDGKKDKKEGETDVPMETAVSK